MSNCRNGNGGHAGGHVRDMFLDAVDAYLAWEDGEPEPTVEFIVRDGNAPSGWGVRPITISRACGIVWNCSDILPSGAVSTLDNCGIELNRRTYAAAARELLWHIKKTLGTLEATP